MTFTRSSKRNSGAEAKPSPTTREKRLQQPSAAGATDRKTPTRPATTSTVSSKFSLMQAAENLADELLQRSRVLPGETLRKCAERIGVRIVEKRLPGASLGVAIASLRTIVLSSSGYGARDEFTIAHELMELHIPGSWHDLPPEMKESACDRGAAALLLPAAAFRSTVAELGLDLPRLRRRWRHASWGTIGRRLVDVGAASTIANWSDLELAWRYGAEAHPDEEHALAEVYAGRGRAQVGAVRAWRLGGAGLGRAVSVGR